MIAYKAEEAGRTVIAVYLRNTSRRCSRCAHRRRESARRDVCVRARGHGEHAVVNAAVDILRAGSGPAALRCVGRELVRAPLYREWARPTDRHEPSALHPRPGPGPPRAFPSDTFAASVTLARRAEELGYRRVWYAEHHNIASIASSATSVLIAHVGAHTTTSAWAPAASCCPTTPRS